MVIFGRSRRLSSGHLQKFSPETMSKTVHLVNHFRCNYKLGFLFLGNFLLYQSGKTPLACLYLLQWPELGVWWPVQKQPIRCFQHQLQMKSPTDWGTGSQWHFLLWHLRKQLKRMHEGCTAYVLAGTKQKLVSKMRWRQVKWRPISVLIGSDIWQK